MPWHVSVCKLTFEKKFKENDQLIVAKALSSPWTLSKKYKKYRFEFDHVLRGVVRNRITIFTAKHSCGAVFHLGRKYLMVVSREGSKFVTHQCHYWEADSEYAEGVIEKYAVKP